MSRRAIFVLIFQRNVRGVSSSVTFHAVLQNQHNMSVSRPAQIFATLASSPGKTENNFQPALEDEFRFKTKKIGPSPGNEIQVTASSELSLAPDRCRVTIFVYSKKENAQDAKNSVARRMDYIVQTLYNHQVKVGLL